MIKKITFALISLYAMPSFGYYENPHQQFDMTRNMTNNTKITFVQVDNVNSACNKESLSRGLGGFHQSVEACSFWRKNFFGQSTCYVMTAKKVNFHTLGHEVRHCIQGAFHK